MTVIRLLAEAIAAFGSQMSASIATLGKSFEKYYVCEAMGILEQEFVEFLRQKEESKFLIGKLSDEIEERFF